MKPIEILVIEDSSTTQNTLKQLFETAFEGSETACHVTTAFSAEEGLGMLREGLCPNAIILDIKLPKMSGGDFLREMMRERKWKKFPVFPYSSLWKEDDDDEPFDHHYKIVKDWYAAQNQSREDDGKVAGVTGKFRGEESITVVNPRIIVLVASVIIEQGRELSFSYKLMLDSAQRQLKAREKEKSS